VHSGRLKTNLRRKRKALSGLEGLLEIVGLEGWRKVLGLVDIRRAGDREFQIVGDAILKFR